MPAMASFLTREKEKHKVERDINTLKPLQKGLSQRSRGLPNERLGLLSHFKYKLQSYYLAFFVSISPRREKSLC